MKNDGGSAFPRSYSYEVDVVPEPRSHKAQDGMSLRDWFAGKILQGHSVGSTHPLASELFYDHTVKHIYRMADRMLEARKMDDKELWSDE